MQIGLDGADAASERLGDLRFGKVVVEAQRQNGALTDGQSADEGPSFIELGVRAPGAGADRVRDVVRRLDADSTSGIS